MGDELWSGWGVRTMSTGDAGFNPLSYHNGTVWPHDNSLVAWGLRAKRPVAGDANRIVQSHDRGGGSSTTSSPRCSPASARRDAVPDRVPDGGAPAGLGGRHAVLCSSSCSASARPRASGRLGHGCQGACRRWAGRSSSTGVPGLRHGSVDVMVESRTAGCASRRRDMRIAVLSPVVVRRPADGLRRDRVVVSLLADGLVEAGHDVTLFASGDSRRRAKLAPSSTRRRATQIGQTFWELQHALTCYARARRVRRDPRPHGPAGSALGVALSRRRVVHTVHGPLDGRAGRSTSSRAAAPARRADLALDEPARAAPDLPWLANCRNALDLDLYPFDAAAAATTSSSSAA